MRVRRIIIFVFAGIAALGSGATTEARGGNQTRIEGQVVHEDGSVIGGATVELAGKRGVVRTGTSSDGTFGFSKVKPGSYTVTAIVVVPPGLFVPDFIGSVEVDVRPGDRANVVIVVHPVG